ncbi:hypothetical protein H6G36_25625 [Anabaena minutissima FACHB-250]|nr:hypothetical protein [Anabaena minutissima FACHB-250]
MVQAYSFIAFQQRINTLLILDAIAKLQKTVTVWAIAILATISFFSMYLAAGKMEKKIVVTDLPKLTGYLHGADYLERRQTSNRNQQEQYEDGYRRGARDSFKGGK